jgi:hypothetical protein
MTTCRKALLLIALLFYVALIWYLGSPGVTIKQVFVWLCAVNFLTFGVAVAALLRK